MGMATTGDLLRLNAVLRSLSQTVFDTTNQQFPDRNSWTTVVLDVRYSADGRSFIDKTRVTLPDGQVTGITLPSSCVLELIELGEARPAGEERWYGVLLRIDPDGSCNIKLNYDPACAEDTSFYES
jgi:hypothetical protein